MTQRKLNPKRLAIVVLHLAMIAAANYGAFLLRFDGSIPRTELLIFAATLPALIVIRSVVFLPLRLYQGVWRYTSVRDLINIVLGVSASSVAFYLIVGLFAVRSYPRSIPIIDSILLVLFMGGVRIRHRVYDEIRRRESGKRILVYGAGDSGELIVRDMKSDERGTYSPVGFVDDDRRKLGLRIHGVPVLGTRQDLRRIFADYKPEEVLLALPRAETAVMRDVVRALQPFKIPIKTLPHLRDLVGGKVALGQIRSLSLEDLLARDPIDLDRAPIQRLIEGRRVMVTGAGGSIGSELCRQIANLRPASLILFEHYENSLHEISLELKRRRPSAGIHPVVGDVTDGRRVGAVLQAYQPDIIFHAAAHKHVPLMEGNPSEAIKNNVRGTRLLAREAEAAGVARFVFISTDKAVNPSSVMGASKRVAELVVQAQAAGSGTAFSIVRFGNVLGSNGSVVPLFVEQIRRGGPVTITHPDMRRFFMLIPEAVQLVLHAASRAENGMTYVLEMGEQVKLTDMARDMIRLSGFVPDEDIKIEFIGLRPGEKLSEELIGPDEESAASSVAKVQRVRSLRPADPDLLHHVAELEHAADEGRDAAVLVMLRTLVQSFDPAVVVDNAAAATDTEDTAAAMSPAWSPGHHTCPSCHCRRARRSRAHGVVERLRKDLTCLRPYRCEACGWRGWLQPLDEAAHAALPVPAVADLAALDSALGPAGTLPRRGFSPRNLN